MLSARPDRAVHAESHGHLTELACGYRCRLLWRLHHFLEFRLGNREDAGRRRVDTRHGLCWSKRSDRLALECGWHPTGQPLVSRGTSRWNERRTPSPPTNLHEYQKKGFTDLQFVSD